MRAETFLVALACLLALAWSQTPMVCPPAFVPASACTQGPCRCAQFDTVLVKSARVSGVLQTTITVRVTNICPDPVYYVQFAILDTNTSTRLTVLQPTGAASGTRYQWTKSIYDGRVAPQTSPPLVWLRFTPTSSAVPPINTQMAINSNSLNYDEFTFVVTGYYPTFRWFYQMHQGANWDTYGPIDNSLCQCGNCDAGFAQRIISSCTLGYSTATPTAPPNYRPPSIFNENEVLYAFQIEGNQLEMFYSDEHALTLGVRRVIHNGVTTDYPISASSNTPQCIQGAALVTGTTIFDGTNPQAGIDGNGAASGCSQSTSQFPCGRPLTPVLYITDISGNPTDKSGDWQYGGTARLPQKVCGVWKAAVKTVTGPAGVVWAFTLQIDSNPTANVNSAKTGWNLGAGADPIPFNNIQSSAFVQSFGAEIAWDLDNLGLRPASRYRFQFIVHDGDQTRTGGDVGQACINIEPACPAGFTGTNCDLCDLIPQPGDGSYSYYCFPTGIPTNPYTLIKVPTSKLQTDPFYYRSGGFVPTNSTDLQGFTVTCNCKRIVKTCPKSCCGLGTCNAATGVCDCSAVDPQFQPEQDTCCPQVNPGQLCVNDGYYCSGHGFCSNGQCICSLGADGTPDWTGPACNISVPKTQTCTQLAAPDCATCQIASQAAGIFCTWCTAYSLDNATGLSVGTCLEAAQCTLNQNPSCQLVTIYVPEPCPDDCSGHGFCRNISNPSRPAACDTNPTLPACNNTLPFLLQCICRDGYTGVNCGEAPNNIVELAAGLGAAAIVGIIIAIIVVIAAVGGGGFAIAQNMAAAPVAPAMNNPLYIGAGRSGHNPLHKA